VNRWLSTTRVAVLLCLLGCSTLFLPWASVLVMAVDPAPQADGSYKAKHTVSESHAGYQLWHGAASAITFFALFLFLLVTGPLRPVPWWRSAILLLGAMCVVVIVLVGLNFRHPALESDLGRGRVILGGLGLTNHAVIGLAAGLGLIAALEMRSRVAANGPGKSAEPGTAADPRRQSGSGG